MIPEQLWYFCRVYPESISGEEAKKVFENNYKEKDYEEKQADLAYWKLALEIIEEEGI